MAKQTFTTGQVLTAAQMTSLQQTAMGGGSATAKTASYVLVAADAGTTVAMNAAGATTITVNTGLFAAGDTVFIQNLGAGVSTITPGTATVNTASSLALAQYESGNLYFTAAGASIFSKADGAAAGGGGKVLQVVQGIKTGTATTSSTTLSDTGITATITPSLATSKILAFVNVNNCRKAGGNVNSGIRMILLRGATTIYNMGSIIAYTNTTGQNDCGSIDGVFLDSPSTTSATTYKVQFASVVATMSIDINNYDSVDDTQSSITLLEIGA